MTVCYWCGAKDTLADIGKELDDGKYKMVQCQKCKNAYYVLNKEKVNKQKTTTNEEWLHTLNTEQLADFIAQYFYGWTTNSTPYDIVLHSVREWLKQPHTFE